MPAPAPQFSGDPRLEHRARQITEAVREMLRELGVTDAGIAIEQANTSAGIHSVELPAVKHAVPRRVLEFAAGRRAARRALGALGVPAAPLPRQAGGAPAWPEGITGSVSHGSGLSIAVVAQSAHAPSVGVDLERGQPLEAELWDEICTPGEAAAIHTLPKAKRGLEVLRIFSAKEAGYKCQFPLTGVMLDMREAELELDAFTGRFTARFLGNYRGLIHPSTLVGVSRFVGDSIVSVARLVERRTADEEGTHLNGPSIALP